MYTLEDVNISDLPDDATDALIKERGENWISSMLWSATYDTRDNIYAPKRGFVGEIALENAGGFLGFDKSFVKGFLVLDYYHPLFLENVILELKGRTGLADGYGDTKDVPIYDRFYVGGAETVRGYKERKIGPRDPGSNAPLGGDAMLVGNAEITFPVYEKLIKGAVFYDIGNAWEHVRDYMKWEGGLKQGFGTGVRVKTPIGPLKLDVGYPLSDNHDDKKQLEWYFSVSHGF
jgi:outer membrane protein insertion porin family